jgi:IclR family acetate operon transcriptional repressor
MLFLRHESLTVSKAANSLGITRSKTHRILTTLTGRGLVELSGSSRGYTPGPAFAELARPLSLDSESRKWARTVLLEAARATGETVHAGVQVGSHVLIFDCVESTHRVRVGSRVGQLRPAYCTSAGKLLLSRLGPRQVELLFPDEQLPELTPSTIATRSRLVAELAEIACHDYALNQEESEPGICGAAVLMQGRTWRDRVSIHVSVPAERASTERLCGMVDQLRAVVADYHRHRSAMTRKQSDGSR